MQVGLDTKATYVPSAHCHPLMINCMPLLDSCPPRLPSAAKRPTAESCLTRSAFLGELDNDPRIGGLIDATSAFEIGERLFLYNMSTRRPRPTLTTQSKRRCSASRAKTSRPRCGWSSCSWARSTRRTIPRVSRTGSCTTTQGEALTDRRVRIEIEEMVVSAKGDEVVRL